MGDFGYSEKNCNNPLKISKIYFCLLLGARFLFIIAV